MVYTSDYEINRIYEIMKEKDKNFINLVKIDDSNDDISQDNELKIIKLAILYLLNMEKGV